MYRISLGYIFRSISIWFWEWTMKTKRLKQSNALKRLWEINFEAVSWSLWLAHRAHGAFLRAGGITGASGRLHYWISTVKLGRVEFNVRVLKAAVLKSILIMRLRESVWYYHVSSCDISSLVHTSTEITDHLTLLTDVSSTRHSSMDSSREFPEVSIFMRWERIDFTSSSSSPATEGNTWRGKSIGKIIKCS